MTNRIIKFMAWDTANAVMIGPDHEDDLLAVKADGTLMLRCGGWEYDKREGKHDTQSLVLMQFTGLHDKNGKEIYEGDIMQRKYKKPNARSESVVGKKVVEWNERLCGWNVQAHNERFADRKWEVIGNIYENPELLK